MKNMIKENYKKIIVILLMLLFIFILFIINFYSNKQNEKVKVKPKEERENIENKNEEITEEKKYYYVDIKGAIKNPGVYKIEEGKRIIDAINASGGLTEKSDTSIINLSKKIYDEMVIIVYTFDEIKEYKNKKLEIEEINKRMSEKIVCPDKSNDSCINSNDKINEKKSNTSKVSINTATLDELMTISGIGESKAKEIIKYREENGNFESIDDVINVSGIGESLFEKIKDSITV